MAKKNDNNETVAISFQVDDEVIDQVRTGDITRLCIDLNDDNYREILENVDGHLMLILDEMPDTYHGCYLYNNGEFPYAIKDSLDFLILEGGEDHCLTKIIGIDTEPGTRFRYQGPDKPIVEDPEGDSCIWEIQFEVVPIPKEPRYYLMRWNPSVSSFTEEDYQACLADMVHGMFRMSWSIYDWQEARRGDFFYMMRTGDDNAGIVFTGQFITDPYPDEDWAGSNKRRMYVDMYCLGASKPGAKPLIPLKKLESAIPAVNWTQGHSGELLSDEVIKEMELFWDND